MSNVKSGQMSASGEWAKHLRPWHKRAFWKRHRKVENALAGLNAGDRPPGRVKRTRLPKD